MLKCDLHMHSVEDPRDVLMHDASELVDHAAALGYQVLALTLHGRLFCPPALRDHAVSKGILLIPGIEFYLEQREVLLLGNVEPYLKLLKTFDDLVALKKERMEDILVIAPHPFYGRGKTVGDKLERYPDAFDAVEFCHFYTTWCNPNRRAQVVAERLGKPMIACSDAHRLCWMHDHYCRVDAAATQESVFSAVRAGRFKNVSRPLSAWRFFGEATWYCGIQDPLRHSRRLGLIRPWRPSRFDSTGRPP